MNNKTLWFRTKKYGWGWTPVTWQGWLIVVLYVVYQTFLVVLINNSLDSRAGVTSFIFLTILGVSILMAICFQFGETPQWQWGGKEKKNHPKRSR